MMPSRELAACLTAGALTLLFATACAMSEPARGADAPNSASDAATPATGPDAGSGVDASAPGPADAAEGPGEERDAGAETADGATEEAPDSGNEQEAFTFCERYSASPIETARLQDERLTGVSGIVASRRNPGILWVHNDFPGVPTVYAVEAASGLTRGVLSAPATMDARNLEDIALARCPMPAGASGEDCLWLADSGDNSKNRTDLSVIALPEPLLSGLGDGTAEGAAVVETWTADRAWRFPFAYPGEKIDAEAFVVEPDGTAFYLIEKVDALEARLFEARGPFADGAPLTLSQVGSLAAREFIITPTLGRMMTGADLHPSRRRFVLRSYIGSFEYRFATDEWASEISDVTPVTVAWGPLSEPQGEAVAYAADGASLWTISEDPEQRPGQGIHFYPCLDATEGAAAQGPPEE